MLATKEYETSDTEIEDEPDYVVPKKKRKRATAKASPSSAAASEAERATANAPNPNLLLMTRDMIRNPTPEDAKRCKNDSNIVRMACINLHNVNSIAIMEWSEAVMLQLSMLHTRLDFSAIDWFTVINILEQHQWRREVVQSLKLHLGVLTTFSEILIKNHKTKLDMRLIRPESMFHTVPVINYEVLKTFRTEPIGIANEQTFKRIRTKSIK